MAEKIQNLALNQKIVNEDGTPTMYFLRLLQDRGIISQGAATDAGNARTIAQAAQAGVDALKLRNINTGTGLAGGGNLTADRTLSLNAGIDLLTDVDTATTPPTNGQVLIWDSASSLWKPGTVSGGGSIEAYYYRDDTVVVINPTPVPDTVIATLNIPASSIARVFTVSGHVNWTTGAHGMGLSVYLDSTKKYPVGGAGSLDPVASGDRNDHNFVSGVIVTVPGDNAAHTITLQWNSQASTSAITRNNVHMSAIKIG